MLPLIDFDVKILIVLMVDFTRIKKKGEVVHLNPILHTLEY